MRPRETALAPSITVEFSHVGADYRVAKTFLDSPKAVLERKRAGGVYDTIAKGNAADDQVREMLRSQPTKAKDKPTGWVSFPSCAAHKASWTCRR
jgi:hypothetical protein